MNACLLSAEAFEPNHLQCHTEAVFYTTMSYCAHNTTKVTGVSFTAQGLRNLADLVITSNTFVPSAVLSYGCM
ncbi:MAG: hypothetical protein Fur005_14340 [Roseiflexaceae bacterium]